MTTLTDYTSYEEVRAVLGVNDDELTDATLSLEVYQSLLEIELESIGGSLETDYHTIQTTSEDSQTSLQKKFVAAVRLFSTYAIAKHAGAALPMYAPKDVTDGKAAFSRFSDGAFRDTLKRVDSMYTTTKQRATTLYTEIGASEVGSSVSVSSFFSVSSATTDPVTGE